MIAQLVVLASVHSAFLTELAGYHVLWEERHLPTPGFLPRAVKHLATLPDNRFWQEVEAYVLAPTLPGFSEREWAKVIGSRLVDFAAVAGYRFRHWTSERSAGTVLVGWAAWIYEVPTGSVDIWPVSGRPWMHDRRLGYQMGYPSRKNYSCPRSTAITLINKVRRAAGSKGKR